MVPPYMDFNIILLCTHNVRLYKISIIPCSCECLLNTDLNLVKCAKMLGLAIISLASMCVVNDLSPADWI